VVRCAMLRRRAAAASIKTLVGSHTRRGAANQNRRHGTFGLVALVGVQSNQSPHALDIARPW
jgi:hypothetical protein